MSTAVEYSSTTKELGDKIVSLTLKEAKQLSDYLKEVHGIEPAGGGVVVSQGPATTGPAPVKEEKTEFDVILAGFDAAKKLGVIKVVRAATGLGLKEAKELVEGAPKPVKTGLSKEDANKLKGEIEAEGGKIEIK